MKNTAVKHIMTEAPVFIGLQDTLMQAAHKMKEINCGFLPVGSANKVLGIITDRDIVIRAVAAGKDVARETVSHHMTHSVYACNEDDFLEDAAERMRNHNISRLLVRNHQGVVTGVLSFGSILRKSADANEVANVVKRAVVKAVA